MLELNRCYAVYLLIAIHPVAKGSGVLAYGCDASPSPIARGKHRNILGKSGKNPL
ncbi:MAG: hypothetical protein QNJ08_11650 [Crocosphaera sp.]|nr:hypothetical protein [Crocosphaera sp.]